MDARLVNTYNGLPGTPQLEGIGRVGGLPPTLGSPGGSPRIMGTQSPSINRALLLWGGAVLVLVVFHVGGAHLG